MPTALFEAYLAGAAGTFYEGYFGDAADRQRAVRRATRPLSPAVATALEAQNARYAPSPARDVHLARLRDGAAAVVTGQQVGLFLGPLFTLYKAASAVCTARALAAETGQAVVPVFWLQTEDHDLPEIAECHVPSAHGPRALRLPTVTAERTSIAHRQLPGDITACLTELHDEIGNLPHAAPHLERLARHYRPGVGWSVAFGGLLAELFAPEGLVLIDPRDAALQASAASVHRRALSAAVELATGLAARERLLADAGFAAPVHVRAGAPLSFFHPDGFAAPRYRLAPADGGFSLVGGDGFCTLSALLAALESEPLRFSSSALLRPILQDTLLPTAAYVGGPAEVGYFGQLPPLYAAFDLPMPLVVPRARLRILEDKTLRLLSRLGLRADDARRPEDELLRQLRGAQPAAMDARRLTRALLDPFSAALEQLRPQIEPAGPGVGAAIGKTLATVQAAVSKLADKHDKACLHQDVALVQDVQRLKTMLHPKGEPQERIYGLSYFAARYGERALIERIVAHIEPFDPTPRDLVLHEAEAGAAALLSEVAS